MKQATDFGRWDHTPRTNSFMRPISLIQFFGFVDLFSAQAQAPPKTKENRHDEVHYGGQK